MKTIVHVTEVLGGGVFTYIRDVANWQANKYDVYIIYHPTILMPDNYKEMFDYRIKMIELPELFRSFNPFKVISASLKLRKAIFDCKPDIVHLHSSFAGFQGRLFMKKRIGNKVVSWFYSPHAYGFVMQGCGKLKQGLYLLLEKIEGLKDCLTITISQSEHIKSRLVTNKSVCINSGINIGELKDIIDSLKTSLNGKTEKPSVFMMGNIAAQKDPWRFNRVAAKFPCIDFRWIGDGELRGILTSPNISITGWLAREDAVGHAMNSDIFLFTTRWEGMSLALLECMYMKKLCIVMDADGNRDVIENGINGFLCYSDEDMISALQSVIAGEVNIEVMTSNARRLVTDEHDAIKRNERLSDVYENYGKGAQFANG